MNLLFNIEAAQNVGFLGCSADRGSFDSENLRVFPDLQLETRRTLLTTQNKGPQRSYLVKSKD